MKKKSQGLKVYRSYNGSPIPNLFACMFIFGVFCLSTNAIRRPGYFVSRL